MRWRRRQSEAPTPTDDEVASFDYIANGIEEVPSFESLANGIASLVVGEASASLTPEVETAAGWQQWQRELENDISAEQSCEAHNANEGVEIRYAPPPPPSPPSVPSPPSRGSKIKGIAGRIASPKLRIRLPKDSNCAEGVSLNLAPQAKKRNKSLPAGRGTPDDSRDDKDSGLLDLDLAVESFNSFFVEHAARESRDRNNAPLSKKNGKKVTGDRGRQATSNGPTLIPPKDCRASDLDRNLLAFKGDDSVLVLLDSEKKSNYFSAFDRVHIAASLAAVEEPSLTDEFHYPAIDGVLMSQVEPLTPSALIRSASFNINRALSGCNDFNEDKDYTTHSSTGGGWRDLENESWTEQSSEVDNESIEVMYAPPSPPSPPSRGSKIKGIAGRIASPKLRIRLPKDSSRAEGVSLNLAPHAKKRNKTEKHGPNSWLLRHFGREPKESREDRDSESFYSYSSEYTRDSQVHSNAQSFADETISRDEPLTPFSFAKSVSFNINNALGGFDDFNEDKDYTTQSYDVTHESTDAGEGNARKPRRYYEL